MKVKQNHQTFFDSMLKTNLLMSTKIITEYYKTKIAGKLTVGDWNDLKIESTRDINWNEAFQFFEMRINTRYLNPIKIIRCFGRNKGEGFTIVNLQCSLIETIECFYNGWIYDEFKYYFREVSSENLAREVNGKYIFNSFFRNRINLPKEDFEYFKNSFYKEVRCGLLHETQTKNGWIIHAQNNSKTFFKSVGDKKIVFRNNLQDAIEILINEYKAAIINGTAFGNLEPKDIRENLKAKFDHICKISIP